MRNEVQHFIKGCLALENGHTSFFPFKTVFRGRLCYSELIYAVLSLSRASHYIFLLLLKKLGTGKFILHPKAAVNPLTAYQVIKLEWTFILTIKHHTL